MPTSRARTSSTVGTRIESGCRGSARNRRASARRSITRSIAGAGTTRGRTNPPVLEGRLSQASVARGRRGQAGDRRDRRRSGSGLARLDRRRFFASMRSRLAPWAPRREPREHFLPLRQILLNLPAAASRRRRSRSPPSDVVLRVAQRRDQRDIEAPQEPRQRLRHARVAAHAIGDDADTSLRAADLGDQQQVGDAFRGRVNVDLGRHHGYEHGVDAARQVRQRKRIDRGRRVDDDGAAVGGTRICQLRVTVADRSNAAMP